MSSNGLTLAAGTPLRESRYSIEAVLGQGGFGITYRAVDTMLSRLVAVKEFFLAGSSRTGTAVRPPPNLADAYAERLDRVREEAKVLARFRHPNIVTVHEFFEENQTLYVVMELLQGRTLADVQRQSGGRVAEPDAIGYVAEIAAALDAVHAEGLLHRDVKPDNVMVVEHGRVVLLDFGTAREFALGQSSPMSQTLTPGYAPVEQYTARGHFGPTTDVYALGATMYHMVTGQFPTPSLDRYGGAELTAPCEVEPSISPAVNDAILAALAMEGEDRPATAGDFARMLGGAAPSTATIRAPSVAVGGSEIDTAEVDGEKRGRFHLSWPARLAAIAVVAVVAVGATVAVMSALDDSSASPPPTAGPPTVPPGPETGGWVVPDDGAAVDVTDAPGTAYAVVATLAPGDTVELTGHVATIEGATWVEVPSGTAAGWVPAKALQAPRPEALADLEFPLRDSVLTLALTVPGRWDAARRAPVRAGPSSSYPEVHAYADGATQIRVTGNVAVVRSRPWAEVFHPEGTGWVRGDRFDLAAQTTFLREPPGQPCSVLAARPLDYASAYQYWEWDGRPPRLDPAGRGVPCTAQYEEDEIARYLERLG